MITICHKLKVHTRRMGSRCSRGEWASPWWCAASSSCCGCSWSGCSSVIWKVIQQQPHYVYIADCKDSTKATLIKDGPFLLPLQRAPGSLLLDGDCVGGFWRRLRGSGVFHRRGPIGGLVGYLLLWWRRLRGLLCHTSRRLASLWK